MFALCAFVLCIDESGKGAAEDPAVSFHLFGVMPEMLVVRRGGHCGVPLLFLIMISHSLRMLRTSESTP